MPDEAYALRTIVETLGLPVGVNERIQSLTDESELRAAASLLMAQTRPEDEDVPHVEALAFRLLDRLADERHRDGAPLAHLWFYPEPAPFAAFLSHDVDEVEWSRRRRLLMALRHPSTLSSRERRYWNFERVSGMEATRGVSSTFFVVPHGSHAKDPPYALGDIAAAIRDLEARGWEVGLHASYESYDKPEMIARQKRDLERVLGHAPAGVRQHFLNFAAPATWENQERAGLRYDSSMGSRDRPGFRTGFCHPYRPEGRRLLEIPLTTMDSQLFWHERLDPDRAYGRTIGLVQTVARYHGVVCLNWHQHVMDDLSFPGWWAAYVRCLDDICALRPWFVKGVQLAEWWDRRSGIVLRERSLSSGSGLWDVVSPHGGPATLRLLPPDGSHWTVSVEHTEAWRAFEIDGAMWVQLENLQPHTPVRLVARRI